MFTSCWIGLERLPSSTCFGRIHKSLDYSTRALHWDIIILFVEWDMSITVTHAWGNSVMISGCM